MRTQIERGDQLSGSRMHCVAWFGLPLRFDMRSTRVQRNIKAPRDVVYRLLVDPNAIVQWKVPDGMSAHVHEFDAREGGRVRVSLTYREATVAGKTTAHTDTYSGQIVRLVPNALVIEVDEFETADPAMRGEMTSTIVLSDSNGGTDLVAVHDGLPSGVSLVDNETGWQMALTKLAALAEAHPSSR